jgi:DNA segregation ATPase FtsK/SpoIIIE, S-DNA-T family
MTQSAGQMELGGKADQLMRRGLNEVDRLRAQIVTDADEIRQLREDVRNTLIAVEQEARAHVGAFVPRDVGETVRTDITHAITGFVPAQPIQAERQPSANLPASFDAAQSEWKEIVAFVEPASRELILAMRKWDLKVFKRRKSRPTIDPELWEATERLSQIHAVLPALREQYVAERLDAKTYLNDDLATEIERRRLVLERSFAAAREVLAEVGREAGLPGADWSDPRWPEAEPSGSLQRVIRAGEVVPALPTSAEIGAVPVLLEHPLGAGVSIAADVTRRQEAIDCARSLVMRLLAATPAGGVQFSFVDPVSLGQSASAFRHLAEFDAHLVDVKSWTSEREIEAKLDELAAHLEVVISTYLRGQFDSIDAYNEHAGEIAEPHRVLVVFDYPTGFSDQAARQLLSLIENGTRCGVHVILHHDPGAGSVEGLPLDRLTHSMQRLDLTSGNGRVTLPEPTGKIDADFLPDQLPPVEFSADGNPKTPTASLLLGVGAASRTAHSGPVTLERVLPILNKLTTAMISSQVPDLRPGAPEIEIADPATWWGAGTAAGACAPIGRSGANDLASLYFSSTEIAGGAIIIGLPRAGKSTALHAAIVSLSMLYSPEELELYLLDSKHGVEFKVYERLPHARIVSINSEREFSVNALQSLDGEIQRRAEVMKEETAGRANITEYRAATGKPMPRIVMFMDEFHELFEEDDALGQAAFQAFSNIVRQGPFAGVHLVVASQTLSSMPAMDRGTLALLPMRVAFMCNESDADLVMGDLNRDVKALSQQGEGIFNPARGDESHNKPFRGTYIAPDQRAELLAEVSHKGAEEGFDRAPRVFDGDRLAVRPATAAEPNATRPVFALGEPFDLDPSAGVTLRRGRGANVLLLGSEGDDPAIAAAAQSCIADAVAAGMKVQVIDFIGDSDAGEGLDLLGLCEALSVRYQGASGLAACLEAMLAEVSARREAGDYRSPGVLLMLNGAHRAFDLSAEDLYEEDPRPASLLARILREGPEVGCHTVALLEGLSQLDQKLGRDLLAEFEWCVAGSGAARGDVATATDNFNAPEVRTSQLLIADRPAAKHRRVRAYPRHSAESLPPSTIGAADE